MTNIFAAKKIIGQTPPRNKIRAVIWLCAAGALIFLSQPGVANRVGLADLKKMIPPVSDMATSPIAADLLTQKISEKEVAADNLRNAQNKPQTGEKKEAAPQTAKDLVIIPKIGAEVPIVTAETYDTNILHALLDEGTVLYPGSAGFGNIGQTVLMGHSAPANWPKIKHDTVFSRIDELAPGDGINVVYEGRTYVYLVVRSQIIMKGNDFPGGPSSASTLVLVSCWPPGRDLQRLAVEAALATD